MRPNFALTPSARVCSWMRQSRGYLQLSLIQSRGYLQRSLIHLLTMTSSSQLMPAAASS